MFLGSYQLGDRIALRLLTRTGAGVPTKPDSHPYARIYGEDGTIALSVQLPLIQQQQITGYFHHRIGLVAPFTAQRYTVVYTWVITNTVYQSTEEFAILAGGDSTGSGITLHFFRQASADYLLMQNDQGTLKRLRSPEIRNA